MYEPAVHPSLFSASEWLWIVGTFVTVILTGIYAVWQHRMKHRSWWVPLAGTVLMISFFVVSWLLLAVGSGYSL